MPTKPLLRICSHAEQTELEIDPSEVWRFADSSAVACTIFRDGNSYRMRFPDLADFIAHKGTGLVQCIPVQGLSQATLEHLYLNQVMPAVLSMLHRPVFHASAVVMSGAALAFVGDSGRGKSTVSTYLALQGNPLVSDDGVELEWTPEGYVALPSHPAIRLWDDSRNRLLPTDAVALPAVQHTSKNRFSSDGLCSFAGQPSLLRGAFFLGDGNTSTVEIRRLTPQDAHIAWLEHAPMLDTRDRDRLRSQFEQITRLIEMEISYTLDYPRDYDRLPELAAALREHLDESR